MAPLAGGRLIDRFYRPASVRDVDSLANVGFRVAAARERSPLAPIRRARQRIIDIGISEDP